MKSLTASCMFVAALIYTSPAVSAGTAVATIVRPPALQQKLDAALAAREAAGFHPHTRHILPNGQPRYVNRLILEDSPYLLQHANNPVDWYPWGKEAFAKARRENKLVFLSIGYSTCHWCHVMERESFEDPAIARLMNANFVAIKVDRESRPDLDHLYMTAVTLLTGSGGWPMNSLLTPDGRTVFGGTYLPPADLTRLLKTAAQDWRAHPANLEAEAARVAQAVQHSMLTESKAAGIEPTLAGQTARLLLQGHDDLQGGFGQAPKFPNEPLLALLLDQAQRDGDAKALAAVETDLTDMDVGGIHDQVGGGFHRYSTDDEWLVPHFEKMLYNQAQLARLYLAAYRLDGNAEYARVARQTLDFVLRDMTAPDGGFYSALDADSAGGEGRFYLWTPAEVRAATRDAAWALQTYQITDAGNFDGSNIPHLSAPVTGAARARLDRIDADLLAARQKRPHPHLDNKVLTGWNGLMITAFAEAADTLSEPRYLRAAERAADFLWRHQRRNDGTLWRVSVNGRADTKGMLEDYAYFAEACIALYDDSGDARWLRRAETLADTMHSRFWGRGGFYLSEADAGTPMARPFDSSDGALPSANGVALHVLAALARRSGETRYEDETQALLAALSGAIVRDPTAHVTLLTGMNRLRLGETGARQYAARGAARIEVRRAGKDAISVHLHLKPGWHVNAEHPLQSDLIPTSVKVVDAPGVHTTRIDYPKPDIVKLGFQATALALYQNDAHIMIHLNSLPAIPVALQLRLQACNDRTCLLPETLRLNVPASAGGDT